MTETTTRLPIALALAAGGQRVLPWRSVVIDGKTVKRPLINDWPSKATTDPATIEKWWEQWPDAQIGRIPGEGEAILDVDTHPGKPNGYETIELDCLEVPDTLCFSTPSGGLHRVYEYDGPTLAKMIGLRPGIDRLTSESGWVGFYGDESDAQRLVSREGVAPLPTWAAQGRAKSKLNGQGTHIDAADFKARLVLPDKPYRTDGPFPAIVKPERFESWDGMKKAVWEWAQAAAEGNEGARTALVEMRNAWYDRPHSSPDDVWQHEWAECLSSAVRKNGKPRYDEEAMLGDEEPAPKQEQQQKQRGSWLSNQITPQSWADRTPPAPPTVLRIQGGGALFAAGRTSRLFGLSGSAKSWAAKAAAVEVLQDGGAVLYLDADSIFEDFREHMILLGTSDTDATSGRLHYARVEGRLGGESFRELLDSQPWKLIVLDGFNASLSMAADPGRSGHDAADVDTFYAKVLNPAADTGAAVVVVDHMRKDGDSDHGSVQKRNNLTGTDYSIKRRTHIAPGAAGYAEIRLTHKDRPGWATSVHAKRGRDLEAAFAYLVVDSTEEGVTKVSVSLDLPPALRTRPTDSTIADTLVLESLLGEVKELGSNAEIRKALKERGRDMDNNRINAAAESLVKDGNAERFPGKRGALGLRAIGDLA